MKVAVLGYGTVGAGVYSMLSDAPGMEAGPVLVRPGKAVESFMVSDAALIFGDPTVDAVVETLGGLDPAYSYGMRALEAGKHFITANKAMVASHGLELAALAREKGAAFLFSAACGGGVPFLHNLALSAETDRIEAVSGILNGTTNYMLDAMQRRGLSYADALSEAQALLTLYENHSRDEFYAYAVQYRDALRAWQAASEAAAAQNAARDAESRLRAERTAALLGSVRMFAEAGTLLEAQSAIGSALEAYRAWHTAQQAAQQAKTRYDALAQALGDIPDLPVPARDVSGLTNEQAETALARTQALGRAVQSQLDQSRGRLEQFGSEVELSAKKQALTQKLDLLNERREALTLARQTLEQANAALAERFSPRLVREASDIFSELTGGRYARVQISRQMDMEAGQPDAAMRRSLFLSGGTADELYLSVRLAVCRLLLPEDAPIVLDDALAMFDDDRLCLALCLLQREAANRQILLFTCQSRERRCLSADG